MKEKGRGSETSERESSDSIVGVTRVRTKRNLSMMMMLMTVVLPILYCFCCHRLVKYNVDVCNTSWSLKNLYPHRYRMSCTINCTARWRSLQKAPYYLYLQAATGSTRYSNNIILYIREEREAANSHERFEK